LDFGAAHHPRPIVPVGFVVTGGVDVLVMSASSPPIPGFGRDLKTDPQMTGAAVRSPLERI